MGSSEILPGTTSISKSCPLGEHVVWILDFDCCSDTTMDEAGVEQVWRAFYRNDPYYPRPGRDISEDQRLWKVFRERFLEASSIILGADIVIGNLPGMLVNKIELGKP
jgi:hypothetical protein